MKTLKSIFTISLVILLSTITFAQPDTESSMVKECTEIIKISSKISANVQQVVALRVKLKSNDKIEEQVLFRLKELNEDFEDLSNNARVLSRGPFSSRAMAAEVSRLVDATQRRSFDAIVFTNTVLNSASDLEKIAEGGALLRKGMQDLKNLAQDIRQEVMQSKNDD